MRGGVLIEEPLYASWQSCGQIGLGEVVGTAWRVLNPLQGTRRGHPGKSVAGG